MISLVGLALVASAYYSPAEAQAMIADARGAAARGDWTETAAEYQRLAEHGLATADVLYNLGTAELVLGKPADAARDLERARAAGAAGSDLDANLALARARSGAPSENALVARLRSRPFVTSAAWILASLCGAALLCAARARARSLGQIG